MSKGGHDIFALVINFLGIDWQPKHATIGFFCAMDTFGQTLAKTLIDLLEKYNLRIFFVAYVKDEGSNLNTITITLKSIVSCEVLDLKENFQGTCFGHAFSKAC
jgi:hypothetical protein